MTRDPADRPIDDEIDREAGREATEDLPGVPDRPVPVLPTTTAAQPITAPGDGFDAVDELASPEEIGEPEERDL